MSPNGNRRLGASEAAVSENEASGRAGGLSALTVDGAARYRSRAICDGCTPTLCGLFRESWGCPPAQVARQRAQAVRDRQARVLRWRVDHAAETAAARRAEFVAAGRALREGLARIGGAA